MQIIKKDKIGYVNSVFFTIILFLVVFNPPLYAGISFSVLAVICSFFVLLANKSYFLRLVRLKTVLRLIQLFLLFFLYILVAFTINYFITLNENVISNLIDNIVSYLSFFIVTFAIVVIFIKKRYSFNTVCILYIQAAIVQVLLALTCLFSPRIKSLFNSLMIANTNSDKIARGIELESEYRNFGFASSLYDIFGFTMAILAIIALCQALKGKKIYFFIVLAIVVAAAINARSSFIIFLIGAIIVITSPKKKTNLGWYVRIFLLLLVVFVVVSYLFSWIVSDTSTEQMLWLATAISDTQALADGESVGYFDALFNNFLIFPDGLSIVFGTGLTPLIAVNHQSDVGYIHYLWQYGLFGSILLYMFYLSMLRLAIRSLTWPYNILIKAILVMIIVYMIKLTCLGYSQASLIFGPLCFLALYYRVYDASIEKTCSSHMKGLR